MSHGSFLGAKKYMWNRCIMERYETNNGIVLHYAPHGEDDHRKEHAIIFLSGHHLGVQPGDDVAEVFSRAEPIFKLMLNFHNHGVENGRKEGCALAQARIERALTKPLGL